MVLSLVGFAVGIFGHLAKSKPFILAGIVIVMVASFGFMGIAFFETGPRFSPESTPPR